MSEPLLVAEGLSKAYGAPVLEDVSLDLAPGEVHAVIGENGAGKSTLARIVAGLVAPERGRMSLRGRPYRPRSRREARGRGIAFVPQEPPAIVTLSVAESLFLGALPARLGVIDRRRLRRDAQAALARVSLGALDPERRVRTLGLGELQLLEIARALVSRCDVLLLDEPTTALAPAEVQLLFAQLRRLCEEGTAVVLITHRLEEVERLAQSVSVLRDGRLVATRRAAQLPRDEMVRLMVGRPVAQAGPRPAALPGDVLLRVEGLSGARFHDVSFEVRRGEVLGLAGLMGAGRSEVLRAIFGAERPTAGRVQIGDGPTPARIRSPRDAVRLGLALVTEDRARDGLLPPLSVAANVTLGSLPRTARLGLLRRRREHDLVRPFAEALGLRARSLDEPITRLSGGNQQKALLARALLREPSVLLLDEPTRGIDVAARAELHRLVRELAGRGKAVVVASSEIEELRALADRVLVLARGRVVGHFRRGEWTPASLMAAAVGAPGGAASGAAGA